MVFLHIPDGYLSLQTTLPALGVMIPFWAVALKKVKRRLQQRQLPLLSLCAAFSFVIMMFNVPVGAGSAHAVGAVLIAVLLGPWAACVAVSTALLIQALVFGDGGVLAFGINCLNMAVIMPFSGYAIYRMIAGKAGPKGRRGLIGVAAGSYIGLNLAALCAAVEFGIQPLLFRAADGTPLYGFYPLSVAVPAMMSVHLLAAGPVEAVVSAGAVAYLARFAPGLLPGAQPEPTPLKPAKRKMALYRPVILALLVLAVLTPLGLFAPGTAWGEWGTSEIKQMIGFVPAGLQKLSGIWHALLPDYSIASLQNGFFASATGYVICAVAGAAAIIGLTALMSFFMSRTRREAEHGHD